MEIMVIVRGLWYEVVNQNNSELWDMVLKVKKKKDNKNPQQTLSKLWLPLPIVAQIQALCGP